jgi:hypothetical protein
MVQAMSATNGEDSEDREGWFTTAADQGIGGGEGGQQQQPGAVQGGGSRARVVGRGRRNVRAACAGAVRWRQARCRTTD